MISVCMKDIGLILIVGTETDCLLVVVGVAMVMSVRMAPPLPLIFLLMIYGESLMFTATLRS